MEILLIRPFFNCSQYLITNNSDNFRRKRGIYLLQRWCDLIILLVNAFRVRRKTDDSGDKRTKKKKDYGKNLRLLKVKFIDKTIPSVVYPRLMHPQMLQLSILVLSERLHLWVLYCKSTLLH